MGTTTEKLTYLQGTKDAIKNAIVAKGVEVPEGTTFRAYAEKVGEIEMGGISDETVSVNFTLSTPNSVIYYCLEKKEDGELVGSVINFYNPGSQKLSVPINSIVYIEAGRKSYVDVSGDGTILVNDSKLNAVLIKKGTVGVYSY